MSLGGIDPFYLVPGMNEGRAALEAPLGGENNGRCRGETSKQGTTFQPPAVLNVPQGERHAGKLAVAASQYQI
eukprot:gene15404-biopygen11230